MADDQHSECRRQMIDLQVRAMRSTAENVRASLSTFAAAVAQSPELRARIAADPAGELTDAFELIVRRIYALIDSAEKVAKQGDGPQTETKEPCDCGAEAINKEPNHGPDADHTPDCASRKAPP
jgi:hypothetical protein